MRFLIILSLLTYAYIAAVEPETPTVPVQGEAPTAAKVLEPSLLTLRNGIRASGQWDPVAKRAYIGGTDYTDALLAREAGAGFTLPKTGGNPAYRTKFELAMKNYDRTQQKVVDQAAYFEKNFLPLGFLWDYLTPLDARFPIVATKNVGAVTAMESNFSVQARESFAVLQKHRKDRLKWATEIQAWMAKLQP